MRLLAASAPRTGWALPRGLGHRCYCAPPPVLTDLRRSRTDAAYLKMDRTVVEALLVGNDGEEKRDI